MSCLEASASVRVKICGLTSLADAQAAVAAGADALGFMFYSQSPRCITPAAAREIIAQLPPLIARVGVFVNPTPEAVRDAIACGVDTLQFHGEEPLEFCRQFAQPVIKALRLRDADSLQACLPYRGLPWLLDSYVPGLRGGTGARFNWDLAVAARKENPCIILAGGLTPDNVAEAVRQVHPFAVDVSSGVELSPGRKDPAKVRAFVAAAKGA